MMKLPIRFGLLTKIIVFLTVVLVPLAAITWYASVRTLRKEMTEEFTSKGTAIANSLASSGVDLILNRDASTVQARVDEVVSGKDAISGVAYVMVYDPQKTLIAHTFHPVVPSDLIDKNLVPGETPKQVREIHYADPVTGAMKSIIDGAAAKSGWFLFAVFGGVALLAVVAGAVFARRITRPLGEIVRVAEQVGRGDLSHSVRVRSHDEIGQLARTFNDTVTRLRSQVLTETERDEEKRRREDLQKNIAVFLETVTQISQGDLRKRGEITPDVLGNVVDAVNLMVEEIGTLLADVRHAAIRVAGSANDMLGATDQMASGAEKQAREATTVSREVETMSRSVQLVASNAASAATAAGQTLEAATRGEIAVRDSLAGMQRIRGEVQVISKRIKSLGDRSLEISEIVNTIEEIASHTNLLALNAAIEAAGAGESGVRFAVVADEIRKLAERAANATKDIAARIRAVQGETQEAVVAMEEGTREVEAGYKVTIRAEESLKAIAGISRTSAELAQEISASSQQQVRGADGVVRAMRSIADVAVHTEQAVLQTRRTVDDLVKLADELTRSLSRFKLATT